MRHLEGARKRMGFLRVGGPGAGEGARARPPGGGTAVARELTAVSSHEIHIDKEVSGQYSATLCYCTARQYACSCTVEHPMNNSRWADISEDGSKNISLPAQWTPKVI